MHQCKQPPSPVCQRLVPTPTAGFKPTRGGARARDGMGAGSGAWGSATGVGLHRAPQPATASAPLRGTWGGRLATPGARRLLAAGRFQSRRQQKGGTHTASLQNSFLQGHRCGSGNVFQSPPKPETRCSAERGMPSQPQEAMSLRRVGGSRAAVPRGYPGKSQLCLGQDPEVQPARAGGNGMVTPNQGSQGQRPQTWHCTQRPSGEAGRSGESPRQNEG